MADGRRSKVHQDGENHQRQNCPHAGGWLQGQGYPAAPTPQEEEEEESERKSQSSNVWYVVGHVCLMLWKRRTALSREGKA